MLALIAFLLGALRKFIVNVVGSLPVAEILMAVVGPVLVLARPQGLRIRAAAATVGLGVAWLLSQIVSDLVNQTSFEDLARGWANIGIMLLGFATWMALLVGGIRRRYAAYLAGLTLAGLYWVGSGNAYVGYNPTEFWDLLMAPWAGPLALLIVWWMYARRPNLALAVAFAYGATAVALGARSHGMAFVFAAIAVLAARWVAGRRFDLSAQVIVKYVFVGGLLLALAFVTLVFTGQRGWLGEKTQAQFAALRQPYNPFHVVLVARSEGAAAVAAIADRPILGHGSWARDPKYAYRSEQLLESIVVPGVDVETTNGGDQWGLFGGHSHVLQAWAWGGVIGAVFWVYQLYLFGKLGLYFVRRPWVPALPVVFWGIWGAYWNILFSPMTWGRGSWAALLAFLLVLRHEVECTEGLVTQPER